MDAEFLSTLSLRRATLQVTPVYTHGRFLSTLSLRRATLAIQGAFGTVAISIHALLAESDHTILRCELTRDISIHALLAESDSGPSRTSPCVVIFLSTLSLRRATSTQKPTVPPMLYFYPRSPCGERLRVQCARVQVQLISIHALLAESDGFRGAYAVVPGQISIHALLAESDPRPWRPSAATSRFLSTLSLRRATPPETDGSGDLGYFYPRSPCGERRP